MLDLPPVDPGIDFVVASHGISKGIEQSTGPQIVAKPYLQMGPLQFAAQWKNITSPVADGEASLSIGVSHKLQQLQIGAGVTYKVLTGVRGPTDNRSWEINASAAQKIGKLGLRIAAIYTPDDLGGARRGLYLEGGPTYDINKLTRVFAVLARRDRANGDDYTAFNTGLSRTLFKGVTAELRWYGTDRSNLGRAYKDRIVVSTRMAL